MSYTVNYADLSKIPLIVEDGTVNATTDITLVGRSVTGFGEYIAQNFVSILENFSSTTPPPRPITGQTWFDTTNNELKVYTVRDKWKTVDGVYISETTPSDNDNGDFWFKSSTKTFSIYNNNEWIPLVDTDPENRMVGRIRYDTNNNPRKTVECLVNNRIVFIASSDSEEWTPQTTGVNLERLPTGELMTTEYPVIKRGINLNVLQTYNIYNFEITELNSLIFDVGRGTVFLENSIYDGDGSGITLRSSINPVNGSIFSVRNLENAAKLWVGNSITSPGNNKFAVGATTIGGEFNEESYSIILDTDGTITAKRAVGDWVATEQEAVERTNNEKIITPFTAGVLINNEISNRIASTQLANAGLDNTKIMTPSTTRQSIFSLIPSSDVAIAGNDNQTLMTPALVKQVINNFITTEEFNNATTEVVTPAAPPPVKQYFQENLQSSGLSGTHITITVEAHPNDPYRYIIGGVLNWEVSYNEDSDVSGSSIAEIYVNETPSDPEQAYLLSSVSQSWFFPSSGSTSGTLFVPQKEIVFSNGLANDISISLRGRYTTTRFNGLSYGHRGSSLSATGYYIG